jgi:hypothetical protein
VTLFLQSELLRAKREAAQLRKEFKALQKQVADKDGALALVRQRLSKAEAELGSERRLFSLSSACICLTVWLCARVGPATAQRRESRWRKRRRRFGCPLPIRLLCFPSTRLCCACQEVTKQRKEMDKQKAQMDYMKHEREHQVSSHLPMLQIVSTLHSRCCFAQNMTLNDSEHSKQLLAQALEIEKNGHNDAKQRLAEAERQVGMQH